MDFQKLLEDVTSYLLDNGPKIIVYLIVLVLGWILINILVRTWKNRMIKKGREEAFAKFMGNLANLLLKLVLLVFISDMLGFQAGYVAAALGAIAFGVGLALQGNLGNLASGIVILVLKPFKVGHFIETSGVSGTVDDIQAFNTVLLTPQNRKVVVPNSMITSNALTNYTETGTARLDMTFSIGYKDDIGKAKSILKEIVESREEVLKEPEYLIAVKQLADSSVNIACNVWVKVDDYWTLFFYFPEAVKTAFDREGISIPFPQMDIHRPD
jgi:small conductance mechanosensitive channel